MKKILCVSVFILAFTAVLPAYCEIVEVESKVTKAVVYINSAQITRQADVNLIQGFNEVIFTNVPENLNESTLTVSAEGSARAKILDAKIKRVFLEEAKSEAVRSIEGQIENLEDKLTEIGSRQNTIKEEREFLKSIKLYAGQQIPEDLVTKMPKAEELDSLNKFLKEKWQGTFGTELEIKKETRETDKKLEKLRKDLAELRQARSREKYLISIEFDVEKEGTLTVSASYLMYQANWFPEYDARVDYEKKNVELVCLGIVRQTSGEDYKDVALTLSTAKPTISGRMPELESWVLMPHQLYRDKKMENRTGWFAGAMDSELSKEGTMPETLEKARMAEAQIEKKLTSVTYKITHPTDIKSDGTKHRLPVFSRDFPVEFQYSATPKLSSFAYLVSKVTNEGEELLPANVRVFFEDVYVGLSNIDAIGKGEKFDLYLGIDEGVKVEREKLKEEVREVWVAGIKRNNKVIATTYKITVESYKTNNIKVNIFDQVPVSQNDQIVVKTLESNPKPDEEDYEDKKGVTRWELTLAPREKKEIIFTYQVEHPRTMNVGL